MRITRGHGWALAPPIALVCGLAVAGTAFAIVGRVATRDEQQLLRNRANELRATLSTSVQTASASLGILGALADPQGHLDSATFERAAGGVLTPGMKTVGLVAVSDTELRVSASIGAGPHQGDVLTGDRAELARRATATGKIASAIFRDGTETRLSLAVPAALGHAVAYQETALAPSKPVPVSKESPYRDLRVALYAGLTPDPTRLILSTEPGLVISGAVVTQSLPIGSGRWSLVVGARQPLTGRFVSRAKWLVLGLSVLLAFLTSAVLQTLVRRRGYAVALVDSTTAELRSTNECLEQLFAKGPVVVLRGEVVDGEPRTTYASPNLATIFHLDPSAVVAAGTVLPWMHPDDVAAVNNARAHVGQTLEDLSVQYRLRQPDGSFRWASATSVSEVDERGVPVFAAYLIDISDRRAAQDAVQAALTAAQEANQSKTEFLSRVSHELRTPLNAILGFGRLVQNASVGTIRDDTEHILKAGQHLLDLINEVLDISRIESGDLHLSPEAVAIHDIVGESIDLIRPIAASHGIHIVADGAKSANVHACADRQRTKQVLLNLLSNAVKYNRPMGTVAVSGQLADDGRVQVKVTDTGPGIRAEDREAVFAPFERLDAVHGEVEGTGIGLALSRRLAEAMGGALTFESVLGKGSTFILDLPVAEEPVGRYERLGDLEPQVSAALNGAARDPVLYIEDNLSNLRLIERVMSRRPDVALISAMQGRLGLALAREHLPMLILLDLHLADVGGEEILRQLLADPATASIPVVMVSADATPGQVARLLCAGAAAYLTKPIDIDQLLHQVDAAVLRRHAHVAHR